LSSFAPELAALLGMVCALMDETGTLLEANAGFLRLIEAHSLADGRSNVARFFIQPNWKSLLKISGAADGEIYRGLLTLDDYMGKTRTLKAGVWHIHGQVRLVAEFDIAELEQLNDTVLGLNRSYALAEFALAQSNFKLETNARALEQSVSELQEANTQLSRMHNQLLQSEKLASIGILAAGVAHEINNPIGFVTSNFSTLKSYVYQLLTLVGAYEATDQLDLIEAMKTEIDLNWLKEDVVLLLDESQSGLDRVKHIVRSLNDFAKINDSEVCQPSDLHEGIECTLSVAWNKIKHQCELRKEYGELPAVMCVLPQINQVVLNLLTNAAQAIPGKGIVTIRTGHTADEVWIEISDTGQGMSPENIKHIFDPFYTTKPVGQGVGLGLPASLGIVERHHGRIDVQSECGNGSVFRVWLPLQQPTLST
jgi:signal transduction histidine kinase